MITAAILAAMAVCLAELYETAEGASSASAERAIRDVFPDQLEGQALRVAGCESAGDPTGHVLRPFARNGQFLGLFQLGSWARSRYLHGPWFGAYANARAALALYRDNGGWRGQWSCAWAA
jgi:hypothetical protein